ncbi:MAG: hypothetical protein LBH37_01580 [Oscillospiraceae bacterium]|nr:hypothetical protein [Oscillospiraceae bacterium]
MCVDDGSTDENLKILEKYAELVRVLRSLRLLKTIFTFN